MILVDLKYRCPFTVSTPHVRTASLFEEVQFLYGCLDVVKNNVIQIAIDVVRHPVPIGKGDVLDTPPLVFICQWLLVERSKVD